MVVVRGTPRRCDGMTRVSELVVVVVGSVAVWSVRKSPSSSGVISFLSRSLTDTATSLMSVVHSHGN